MGNDVEPVEEILAERAVANGGFEIAVRRRDDADVHFDWLRAAEPFDGALLNHAQQLDLHLHRELADFVEEERRLVGGFEAPDLPRQRTGVCAALASEQLAFDERGRNGGAADHAHRPLMPRTQVVDGLREHFLADAGLTAKQDRGRCGCHLFDLCERALEGRALGDDHSRQSGHPRVATAVQWFVGESIAQPVDLAKRLRQRRLARMTCQRLTNDARNQTQTLDERGAPLVFGRGRAKREGAGDVVRFAGDRDRDDRGGNRSVLLHSFTIDGIGQLVCAREPDRFSCGKPRHDMRDRGDRHRERCRRVRTADPGMRDRRDRLAFGPAPQQSAIELQRLSQLSQVVRDDVIERDRVGSGDLEGDVGDQALKAQMLVLDGRETLFEVKQVGDVGDRDDGVRSVPDERDVAPEFQWDGHAVFSQTADDATRRPLLASRARFVCRKENHVVARPADEFAGPVTENRAGAAVRRKNLVGLPQNEHALRSLFDGNPQEIERLGRLHFLQFANKTGAFAVRNGRGIHGSSFQI